MVLSLVGTKTVRGCAVLLRRVSAIPRGIRKAEIQLREAYTENERSYDVDWDSYNGALVALSRVATPAVSAATAEMSDAIQELTVLASEPTVNDHSDYQKVHARLSSNQLAFVNAARFELNRSHQRLDWQRGCPPAWARVDGWLEKANQKRATD